MFASRVAVRKKLLSGVTQRIISSTAFGMSDGSAAIASQSSGWFVSSTSPRAMTVRLVSAPPEMNSPVSWTRTEVSIGLPSSCALAQIEKRSSAGAARRSSTSGASTPANS